MFTEASPFFAHTTLVQLFAVVVVGVLLLIAVVGVLFGATYRVFRWVGRDFLWGAHRFALNAAMCVLFTVFFVGVICMCIAVAPTAQPVFYGIAFFVISVLAISIYATFCIALDEWHYNVGPAVFAQVVTVLSLLEQGASTLSDSERDMLLVAFDRVRPILKKDEQ